MRIILWTFEMEGIQMNHPYRMIHLLPLILKISTHHMIWVVSLQSKERNHLSRPFWITLTRKIYNKPTWISSCLQRLSSKLSNRSFNLCFIGAYIRQSLKSISISNQMIYIIYGKFWIGFSTLVPLPPWFMLKWRT